MNYQTYFKAAEKELRAKRQATGDDFSHGDIERLAYSNIENDGYSIEYCVKQNAVFGNGEKAHKVNCTTATKGDDVTILKASSYCGSQTWKSGMRLVAYECTCKKCLK